MSEPTNERARLLDGDATELESILLRAGRRDVPPDPALRAERIANIKVAARATAAVGGGLLALRIVGFLRAGAWKWVALGVSVTAVGASVVPLAYDAPPDRAPAPVVATAPRATAPSRVATAIATSATSAEPPHVIASSSVPLPPPDRASRPVPPAAPRREPLAAAPPAPPPPPPPPPPPTAETPRAASIREEIAALEGIRRSIEGSQPDRALAALDQFQSSHPSSVLAEEASVLRIEALLQAGRTAEARRLVDRFREQYPKSSYTARIRARFDDRE